MKNDMKKTTDYLDATPINKRRDAFYALAREAMLDWVNLDGTPKDGHKVFAGTSEGNIYPNREPFRSVPCLYSGEQRHINLANAMVARYCHTPPPDEFHPPSYAENEDRSLQFGIFQSNNAAAILHKYGKLLSPEARKIIEYHTRLVFEQYPGSAQIDFSFHGANDNMPAMSVVGLILGGEALGNEHAVAHGLWKLRRFRRTLSRNAWASEYNSGTYSGITLASMAKIASESRTREAREIALEIEERLWAELLLHWHPATRCQAGPASRAYMVDGANHTHNQTTLLWLAFGPEATGRDLIRTCFEHDGIEIVHFAGYQPSNIVEYVEMLDMEPHVPTWLADLIQTRSYPSRLKGTVEEMSTSKTGGGSGICHTTTYMEESFSLGSVDSPFCGGEQTTSLYATFRKASEVNSFKDSGVLFTKYLINDPLYGEPDHSARFDDGKVPAFGEGYIKSHANMLTLQKDGTAMLLAQPHCREDQHLRHMAEEAGITSLKLSLILPAHYGKAKSVLVGDQSINDFAFKSDSVQPISIDTGDVYIHINPLLPTNQPRDCAIELTRENAYEVIHLINYRGPARNFSCAELARMQNGCVVTLRHHSEFADFAAFHDAMRQVRIHDYWAHLRYVLFQREDVELEMVVSLEPMSAQTLSIDGRPPERPMIESSEIDVTNLPFVTGEVPRDEPFFPWRTLMAYPFNNTWGIGATGLPGEVPYSNLKGS